MDRCLRSVVTETSLKTVVTLSLPGKSDVVELVVKRKWDKVRTDERPTTSCSIMMYKPNWDEAMAPVQHQAAPLGGWSADLDILFPGEGDGESKVEAFITQVMELGDALGSGRKQ
jgi:hypothetical protein